MPDKKILQDVVPVKLHKIHATPAVPASPRRAESDRAAFHHFQKPKRGRRERKNNPRRRKIWMIALLVLVCFGIIIAAITYVYAKAVVIVTPKTEQVAVSGTYTATKDSAAAGGLSYEVVQTSESASTSVSASRGPLVQTKAWGEIILYNAYSSVPQKLLLGTHLSNDKGLIYTTASTVTVPGIRKIPTAGNPNATSTGSVAVYIVAEQPGAQYDISPADLTGDFKIVAFQGTPKYAGFYGRLEPNKSVVGGYSGYKQVIATTTLGDVAASLTETITSALTSDLKALVPQGYVIYNGAYAIRLASTTVSGMSSTTNSADVSMEGSLYGIMFKETDLAKAVAPAQVAEFPPGQFVINGLDSLTFNPVALSQTGGPISFALKGSFGMVGTFPTDALAQGLVGLSIPQSKAIFAKYSTIMSAHAIITPFWKHSFPGSANKITIDIQQ